MRKFLAITSLALLAGCSSAKYANIVSAIQNNAAGIQAVATAVAATACPVTPTAQQIAAAIVGANNAAANGAIVTSTAVAHILCSALATPTTP